MAYHCNRCLPAVIVKGRDAGARVVQKLEFVAATTDRPHGKSARRLPGFRTIHKRNYQYRDCVNFIVEYRDG